ncbi:hypothetical protein BJX68DRAFT_267014 [Aspergillus pseudodeflectus]|uniref:Uncharacterized protein n=1 Tax=Aspergillus pseudodeflectus TaxID=176178 RepID=A0ABR4KBM4_9EURO
MVCETINTMCEECKALILEMQNFVKLINCLSVERSANTTPIAFTRSYNRVELQKVDWMDEVCCALEKALHDCILVDEGVIAFHIRGSYTDLQVRFLDDRVLDFSLLVNLPASFEVNSETVANIIDALKSPTQPSSGEHQSHPGDRHVEDGSLAQQDKARRLRTTTLTDTWVCQRCPDPAHANLWRLRLFAELLRKRRPPTRVWSNLLVEQPSAVWEAGWSPT